MYFTRAWDSLSEWIRMLEVWSLALERYPFHGFWATLAKMTSFLLNYECTLFFKILRSGYWKENVDPLLWEQAWETKFCPSLRPGRLSGLSLQGMSSEVFGRVIHKHKGRKWASQFLYLYYPTKAAGHNKMLRPNTEIIKKKLMHKPEFFLGDSYSFCTYLIQDCMMIKR